MSDINSEMKAAADYAIRSAKEKFGQELDYSDESIDKLENLLDQAYHSFANLAQDDKTGGAISRTANIWGSYLGEFLHQKWGGSWILRGTERLVSINNIELSPISFVYQRITGHPEQSVDKYLFEVKNQLTQLSLIPQEQTEFISQQQRQHNSNQVKNTITINKNIIFFLAGMGVVLIIIACIFGYSILRTGGLPLFSFLASTTNQSPIDVLKTETDAMKPPELTSTPRPTDTSEPTVTPKPTNTPTQKPIIFSGPISQYMPLASELPSNFVVGTSASVDYVKENLPTGNQDIIYFDDARETDPIDGTPFGIVYWVIILKNENDAIKTFELMNTPDSRKIMLSMTMSSVAAEQAGTVLEINYPQSICDGLKIYRTFTHFIISMVGTYANCRVNNVVILISSIAQESGGGQHISDDVLAQQANSFLSVVIDKLK